MSGGPDCSPQGSHHMQTNGAAIKRTWAFMSWSELRPPPQESKTKSLYIKSQSRCCPSSRAPLHTELTLRCLPHHSGFLFYRGAFCRVRITRCEGTERERACSILHVVRLRTRASHSSSVGSALFCVVVLHSCRTHLKYYRTKAYGRKSKKVFGSSLILATSCVFVLWHICSRQELWSQQKHALLGKGSANTPVARQHSRNTKQWSNWEAVFSMRSVR
jgi:hypothetical protein